MWRLSEWDRNCKHGFTVFISGVRFIFSPLKWNTIKLSSTVHAERERGTLSRKSMASYTKDQAAILAHKLQCNIRWSNQINSSHTHEHIGQNSNEVPVFGWSTHENAVIFFFGSILQWPEKTSLVIFYNRLLCTCRKQTNILKKKKISEEVDIKGSVTATAVGLHLALSRECTQSPCLDVHVSLCCQIH